MNRRSDWHLFSGYENCEEVVTAAEWLLLVGKRDDMEVATNLVGGNIALSIDVAPTRVGNLEAILWSNGRTGIAPMTGGPEAVNVAFTTGLVMPKYSQNKDLDMEFLRY
jgi:hypothetical protein